MMDLDFAAFLDEYRVFVHILDISIIATIIYRIIVMIRGTRAVQMLWGLVLIAVAYVASQWLELLTLNALLTNFLSQFILIILVLFQNDIRRALTQVGRSPFFSSGSSLEESLMVEELTRAAVTLSGRRIGALMVIERNVALGDYIESGTPTDARISRELLHSIFLTSGPLHDGAVIIQNGRLVAAGCILPLTLSQDIPRDMGTRHRAGIGLSEETDAVVIIVSEESGRISIAYDGEVKSVSDAKDLRQRLSNLLSDTVD